MGKAMESLLVGMTNMGFGSPPTHGPSNELIQWMPPPATVFAMLEELLIALHKRTDIFHVIDIPRLMNP